MGGDGRAGGGWGSEHYRELRKWAVMLKLLKKAFMPSARSWSPSSIGPPFHLKPVIFLIVDQVCCTPSGLSPVGFFPLFNLPLKFFLLAFTLSRSPSLKAIFFWFSRAFRQLVTKGILLGGIKSLCWGCWHLHRA